MKKNEQKRSRVAIIYNCFQHYREPVIRLLCSQKSPDPEYTMISGRKSVSTGLKVVDPALAALPADQGGIRWQLIRHYYFGRVFLWQTGLIRLALSRKYDTIIYLGSMYYLSTWVSAILARLSGKRVLMWSHGFYGHEGRIKALVRRTFYKLAHAMLLYGNWSRGLMIKMGFDPKKLYVIYNSLNYQLQCKIRGEVTPLDTEKLRQKLFDDPSLPVLVFIGRLIPSKQLDLLIEAAGLLKQQGKLVNVLLIGEGPDQEHLQEKTRQLDLDKHVVFYGACHDEQEVGPLLCMSDICVSPGPIGLTVMHSMVYGTPVISNDDPTYQMPEFEAIIPGATGDFFENKNAKSLASVILKVLDDIQTRGTKAVQHDCYDMISRYFTPASQTLIFNEAVKGTPADTLPLLDTAYLREQLAKWRCHY